MLSRRAAAWAKLPQWHGPQSVYDAVHNPDGIVSFGNAENVSIHFHCFHVHRLAIS